ncbi:hypothetical protein [Pseudoroseicyclus sp. CXY001]
MLTILGESLLTALGRGRDTSHQRERAERELRRQQQIRERDERYWERRW